MSYHTTVAACALDQWALDFEGNLARVLKSCRLATERGAKFRVGSELELCGYGCEDAFNETDTCFHSIEVLRELLLSDATDGLLCDFGLPMMHRGARYNCRVLALNREILLIRPKQALANDGNYRETRWFARWSKPYEWESHTLDPMLLVVPTAKRVVPFGDLYLQLNDTSVGVESCEELFVPESPHVRMGLSGVEIVANGSGSHHELRKLNKRIDLICNASGKSGGIYLYSNQSGCDGGRLGFDGCALVAVNGDVVAQGQQFTVSDVEVVTATVDLAAVRGYRSFSASRAVQVAESPKTMPFVTVDWNLCHATRGEMPHVSRPIPVFYHTPEEEIARGPAVWMWDYLRRSGARGFFLPLSGGADSSSTAAITYSMCRMVAKAANEGDETVIADVQRITRRTDYVKGKYDAHELANAILHTAYLGTSNSSQGTRDFAESLAKEIGNYHMYANIDPVINGIISLFESVTNHPAPRYAVHGGHHAENQALQNIQARFRMVFSYMLAQLLPWVRWGRDSGFLIVLGSANVDEGLRGYLTKYDCSSADVNPIGGISKVDLKRFLLWGATERGLNLPSLTGITTQPPTAELEPITDTHKQSDEEDMGCTYVELGWFGRLRKVELLGPLFMYRRLLDVWNDMSPVQVAEKVEFLFRHYSINRHKMTTITPSYHCENYSPDDNRYDLRQFLYNTKWTWQFARIDRLAKAATEEAKAAEESRL